VNFVDFGSSGSYKIDYIDLKLARFIALYQ